MFNPLRIEVLGRFTAADSFFRFAHGPDRTAPQAQTAKGLAFVQIYAIYEYTVCTVFRIAIDSLVSHKHSTKALTPSLMALFLDPQLRSLRDCSPSNVWSRRLELFGTIFSRASAKVPNTVLPSDGTHFRHTQLELIFEVFGIKWMPARRRIHLRMAQMKSVCLLLIGVIEHYCSNPTRHRR